MLINCNNNAIHIPSSECNSCENFADQLSQKQDKLTAGDGISIEGNVISAQNGVLGEVRIIAYEVADNVGIPANDNVNVSFVGIPDQTVTLEEDGVTKTYKLVELSTPVNVRVHNGTVNGYLSSFCILSNVHSTGCNLHNTGTVAATVRVVGAWLYQRIA